MKRHIDNKTALKIIVDTAKRYDEKLNDKHFLILYQVGGETKSVSVAFRDMNYLHLTGVKSKLSAQQFYSACLSGKLSEKNYSIDTKGKAQQKLAVLPYLPDMLFHNCMIGDFINSGIYLKTDYFVGDTKAVLSVGFCYGRTADIPVTLYNENVKWLIKPVSKVLAIFSKMYNDEKYTTCTYLSKRQEISKLKIPEGVKVEVFQL